MAPFMSEGKGYTTLVTAAVIVLLCIPQWVQCNRLQSSRWRREQQTPIQNEVSNATEISVNETGKADITTHPPGLTSSNTTTAKTLEELGTESTMETTTTTKISEAAEASLTAASVAASITTTELPAVVGRSKACKMVVGIDSLLYEHYEQNENVNKVNNIFARQILDKENGFEDVYFHVARIQVMHGTCDNQVDQNCTHYREEYLRHFDRHNFSSFCLAYMFTFIDFDNGTAGLAHIGTLCRPSQNTGFVTLLNHKEVKDSEDTSLTLAHEIGHNFGAPHDNDVDNEECKGKGYIMNDVLVHEEGSNSSSLENRERFSPCSVQEMKEKTLSKITAGEIHNCFVDLPYDIMKNKPVLTICGNKIVEEGEECDCGMTEKECNDACCYPANIGASDRYANESALPCSRTARRDCVHPPGLVYGIYVPFAVMLAAVVLIVIFLIRDWRRSKSCFQHVTNGNIRIVRR